MSGKSDGIWADLRKQRKIKYRDRDIMDHQHADFRGNSGVRFVCRLKGGASAKVHRFGVLVTCQVVGIHEK